MNDKPLEFWINGPAYIWNRNNSCEGPTLDPGEQVHVIEYSAFRKLQKENEILREAIKTTLKEGGPILVDYAEYLEKILSDADAIKEGE